MNDFVIEVPLALKTFVSDKTRVTGGRCCDHNFLRFLPIFGEQIGVFSKTNVMFKNFA
jgi:hypothetical protein